MIKLLIRIVIALVAAALVAGGYFIWDQIPREEREYALTEVRKGDLIVRTHLRGELRAVRSLTLTAPNIGTQSQVTQLAPTGSLAKRGDLIFELDDSERVAALEDSLLSVEQIQENLKKAESELEIRKSQDEVEIVQANFQVRRAELEVRRNELLAAIDARKNELTLEEAKRRKQKLEEDIKNRLQQREAELAVLREQLNKAQLDVERDRRRIEQSRVLAPLTGLVSVLQNRSGGRGGFGQSLPEIREGDQIPAGMSVAQLLDLSEMELMARVEESERANLREEQEVLIRLDALPHQTVSGTIKRLGNTAAANIFAGEATKKFECTVAIDMRQLLENIGAEAAQVERIMATARQNAAVGYGRQANRQRAQPGGGQVEGQARGNDRRQAGAAQSGLGGPGEGRGQRQPRGDRSGTGQAGGRQRGQQAATEGGQQRGQQAAPEGGRQRGQGQRRGGFDPAAMLSRLPEDARKKAEALLKGRGPQELSNEERQQFRQIMQSAFGGRGGRGGTTQGGPGGGRGGFSGGQGGFGGGQRTFAGGQGAFGSQQGFGGAGGGQSPRTLASPTSEFSAAERAAATLPSPPQEGSDVDVLLRPGLLADAEVIVEHIRDTLYIPYQAVFEEGTQSIVYVLESGRLRARRVRLGRRSESQVAVVEGLTEGEQISLYRPDSELAPASQKDNTTSGPSFPGGA